MAVLSESPPTSRRMSVRWQASTLLLCSLVAAAASTAALGIMAVIQTDVGPVGPVGPPPGPGLQPGTRPVPPNSSIPLIITAAVFVVSWIAVAFAFCRDQVLHRVSAMEASVHVVATEQQALRADFATLRHDIAEYAEQRETDGFLNGRRAATPSASNGEVRLRRVPPLD